MGDFPCRLCPGGTDNRIIELESDNVDEDGAEETVDDAMDAVPSE